MRWTLNPGTAAPLIREKPSWDSVTREANVIDRRRGCEVSQPVRLSASRVPSCAEPAPSSSESRIGGKTRCFSEYAQ